jgi:Na+/H+-dicarboxylate symporter
MASPASSATIPMTLKSVRSTGVVPESVLRFVVPLGATINMDGSAIYFPCAVSGSVLNGIEPNVAHYLLVTIGSAGTAFSAGLVLIVTVYNTLGTTGIPDGFSFIVAIDWFLTLHHCDVTTVSGDAYCDGLINTRYFSPLSTFVPQAMLWYADGSIICSANDMMDRDDDDIAHSIAVPLRRKAGYELNSS